MRAFPLAASLLTFVSLHAAAVTAQEDSSGDQPDGPWISSVAWAGDSELVGTRSQGLLLRPAQVVKVSTSELSNLTPIGEAATSLWTTLPVGEQVITTDYKGGIHLLGGDEPIQFESNEEPPVRWIRCLAKVDGNTVLAGTEDGRILVLSLDEHKVSKSLEAHSAAIFDIAVNDSGNQIATCSADGQIKVMTYPDFEEVCAMKQGNEAIWSVAFTGDGSRLVSGGSLRRLQLWDIKSGSSICTITKAANWISDIVTLPDSSIVAAACMDGNLIVADTQSMARVAVVPAAQSAIWSASLSSSGDQIAIGTRKHGFGLVDVEGWAEKASAQRAELEKIRPPKPQHAE